jgi:hypothetical protein
MRKSMVLALACAGASLPLLGCFDVEQRVALQRDLSGKASFNMTVDFEPMVELMAGMQHSMSGKPGEVTPAEIAQARKEFLEQQKKKQGGEAAAKKEEYVAKKAELEKTLPPGIQLLSASVEDQGLKMVARFEFAFKDVRQLAQIKLPEKGGDEQSGQNPYGEPFSRLKVVDEGPTLLVTLEGADPAARMKDQGDKSGAAQSPEMQKAFATAFKNARFAFRLDSPFEVIETNATRRDGRSLYWEIKASDPNASLPQTLTARLKK